MKIQNNFLNRQKKQNTHTHSHIHAQNTKHQQNKILTFIPKHCMQIINISKQRTKKQKETTQSTKMLSRMKKKT